MISRNLDPGRWFVALSGGMTMPWVAGHLAEASGVGAVFVLAAANFIAIAVLSAIASRT